MGILWTIAIGFFAGLVAKIVMPDPRGSINAAFPGIERAAAGALFLLVNHHPVTKRA